MSRHMGPYLLVWHASPIEAAKMIPDTRVYSHLRELANVFAQVEPELVPLNPESPPTDLQTRCAKHYVTAFEREPRARGYAAAYVGTLAARKRVISDIRAARHNPLAFIPEMRASARLAQFVALRADYAPIDDRVASALGRYVPSESRYSTEAMRLVRFPAKWDERDVIRSTAQWGRWYLAGDFVAPDALRGSL